MMIQGHPDPAGSHLLHALADAYAHGATRAGHDVRRTEVAHLEFPLLRTQADFETGAVPAALALPASDNPPDRLCYLDPNRGVVTRLFPSPHMTIDICGDKPARQRRAQQQMVNAQSGVPGVGVSKILPEGVYPLGRV